MRAREARVDLPAKVRRFLSPLFVLFAIVVLLVGPLFVLVLADPLPLASAEVDAGEMLAVEPHSVSPLDPSPTEVDVVGGHAPTECFGYCPPFPRYWSTWTVSLMDCGTVQCANGSAHRTVASSGPASGGEVDSDGTVGHVYAVLVQNTGFELSNPPDMAVANVTIPVIASELVPFDGGWPGLGLVVAGLAGVL